MNMNVIWAFVLHSSDMKDATCRASARKEFATGRGEEGNQSFESVASTKEALTTSKNNES